MEHDYSRSLMDDNSIIGRRSHHGSTESINIDSPPLSPIEPSSKSHLNNVSSLAFAKLSMNNDISKKLMYLRNSSNTSSNDNVHNPSYIKHHCNGNNMEGLKTTLVLQDVLQQYDTSVVEKLKVTLEEERKCNDDKTKTIEALKKRIDELTPTKVIVKDSESQMSPPVLQEKDYEERKDMSLLNEDIYIMNSVLREENIELKTRCAMLSMQRDELEYSNGYEVNKLKENLSDTEERYFHALVLSIKLSLSTNSLPQGTIMQSISASELFEKACTEGIDHTQWPVWIHHELIVQA